MVTSLVVLVSMAALCGATPAPQVVAGGHLLSAVPLSLTGLGAHYPLPGQLLLTPQPAVHGHLLLQSLGSSYLPQEVATRSTSDLRRQQQPVVQRGLGLTPAAASSRGGDFVRDQELDGRSRSTVRQQTNGELDGVIPVSGPGAESGATNFFRQQTGVGSADSGSARSFARQQTVTEQQPTNGASDGNVIPVDARVIADQETDSGTRNFFRQQTSLGSPGSSTVLQGQELGSSARSFQRQQTVGEPQLVNGALDNNVVPVGVRVFNDQEAESGARSFFRQQTSLGSTGNSVLQGQELGGTARNFQIQQTFSEPQLVNGALDNNIGPARARVIAGQEVDSGARNVFLQRADGQQQVVPGAFGVAPAGANTFAGPEGEVRGRNFFREPQILSGQPGRLGAPLVQVDSGTGRFLDQQLFGGRGHGQMSVVVDNVLTAQDGGSDEDNLMRGFPGSIPDIDSNSITVDAFDETRFRSSRPMGAVRYQELEYRRPELPQGGYFSDGRVAGTSPAQTPEQIVGDARLQQVSAEVPSDLQIPAGLATSLADARSGQQQYSVSFEGSGFGYGYSVKGDVGSSTQQLTAFSRSSALPQGLVS